MKVVVLNEKDNVATALVEIRKGEEIRIGSMSIVAKSDIPVGHKIAIRKTKKGEFVIKYGLPIGVATEDISPGDYVHTHNLRSRYQGVRYGGK